MLCIRKVAPPPKCKLAYFYGGVNRQKDILQFPIWIRDMKRYSINGLEVVLSLDVSDYPIKDLRNLVLHQWGVLIFFALVRNEMDRSA